MRGGKALAVVLLPMMFAALTTVVGGAAPQDGIPALPDDDGASCGREHLDLPAGAASANDHLCPTAIRPGARMSFPSGCTMNFVVTDGTSYYIGTAGHCVSHVGQRVGLHGIGWIGTVALKGGYDGDWAFVQIDPAMEHRIDGTMCRYGGPHAGPLGVAVRDPLPGETVFHYGHGRGMGTNEATRARGGGGSVVSPIDLWVVGQRSFGYVGIVGPGDSGSPVILATGEATGIVSAHLSAFNPLDGIAPSVVIAYRFTSAMDALAGSIGTNVTVVEGRVLPPELDPLAP